MKHYVTRRQYALQARSNLGTWVTVIGHLGEAKAAQMLRDLRVNAGDPYAYRAVEETT